MNLNYCPIKPLSFLLITLLTFACQGGQKEVQSSTPEKYNVLFIAIDDLRPELGCYGKSHIKSPNIDKLAANGLLFEHAYCQQAVCSPSRTSLMTGLRPDFTKVHDLKTHFRTTIPDVVTIPQYFIQNGYHSTFQGKIYHATLLDEKSWTVQGDRMETKENWQAYILEESLEKMANNNGGGGPPFEIADVPDNAYPDGKITDSAIETLNKIKDEAFFLAVGYYKPHLPFNTPKRYWDMYDSAKIHLPENMNPPENAPDLATTEWGELRNYYGIPKEGPLSEEMALKLIHGYYASVSYADAQVGKLMDELDRLGLRESTIVVLWGDHGWKLGEYGDWCKHTNFELDTHAPLIVSAPNMKAKGGKTKALVEFVDIYPSLCELAGLEIPERLQGTSFAPLLNDPEMEWKKAAFSQFPRGSSIMGYSIKTKDYRFTRWEDQQNVDSVIAIELYDHQKDPGGNVNVAYQKEYEHVVKEHMHILDNGWQTIRKNLAMQD